MPEKHPKRSLRNFLSSDKSYLISSNDLAKSKYLLSTLLKLDLSHWMCFLDLSNSLLDWWIGISKQRVGSPVFAHSVEVTAESIPPDTPITKPLVFEFFE